MTKFSFSHALLDWFDQHGRKDLPWQKNISPYRVWVSEIMLQQTQVNSVIPYFERFIQAFPSIDKLALAEADRVLSLWAGLGYYARARNLHKTAQIIHTEYQGEFPQSLEELTSLPGIGRSTAGAIISISMQGCAAILDGNVKRVLTRFLAIDGWPGKSSVEKKLWHYAEHFTPTKRVADYTQAIMDLGATLCTRSKPNCHLCPLSPECKALKSGQQDQFPTSKPKKDIPTRSAFFLILQDQQGKVLMEKRPPNGIWGGLWSLPEHEDEETLLHCIEQQHHCSLKLIKPGKKLHHTFSHFRLIIQPIHATTVTQPNHILEPDRWDWFNQEELKEKGLPAPVSKLFNSP